MVSVGFLLVLSTQMEGLSSLSLNKEGFTVQLRDLRVRTLQNDRAIAINDLALANLDLLLLSMGSGAYGNLRKLASGAFGPYEMRPSEGLETELYHLRNLGYVSLTPEAEERFKSIHRIPNSGEQLSDYIEITQAGKKYIELREKRTLKA